MSRLIAMGIDLSEFVILDRSALEMLEAIGDHFNVVSKAASNGDARALETLTAAGSLYMAAGRYVGDLMARERFAADPGGTETKPLANKEDR